MNLINFEEDFFASYSRNATPNFIPSQYQQAIFEWITDGTGSCVVSAVPGSGKTTTLVQGTAYISRKKRAKFLAFNKHIAQELNNKLPLYIGASTIHSLGLTGIKRSIGIQEIDKYKYNKLATEYLNAQSIHNSNLRQLLIELVRFTQVTLTNPKNPQALKQMCLYYGLSISGNWDFWSQAVTAILERGIYLAQYSISFDDMIWLPNILNLPLDTFDFLCIDEAQDLNKAQLEIIMKATHQDSRCLFVGDRNQAIMAFSAADHRSIDKIIDRTSSIQLPLSICYRCPTSHIELANQIYPVIEPSPNAIEGTVEEINSTEITQLAQPGDLIICRCFYPLVPVYLDLLAAGIPAQIEKKDIGRQLLSLLGAIFSDDSVEMTCTEFTEVLRNWYEQQKAIMLAEQVPAMTIIALHDKVNALLAIYRGNNCKTICSLKNLINNLSRTDKKNVVRLTTIHGAKGLEARRVFHLKSYLVPHPKAEKDWEIEQENNLLFVALTRAKETLFIC